MVVVGDVAHSTLQSQLSLGLGLGVAVVACYWNSYTFFEWSSYSGARLVPALHTHFSLT